MGWLFVDYTLIDFPSWMQEAKEAEERARAQHAGAGDVQAGELHAPEVVAAVAPTGH